MSQLSYLEMDTQLKNMDLSGCSPYIISILRNVTLETMEVLLRYFAQQIGLDARIRFGAYDNILQEAIEGPGHVLKDTQLVLVFTALENISWNLARYFNVLTPEEIEKERAHVGNYFRSALAGIRRQTRAPILWHSFELPIYPARGIAESGKSDGQQAAIVSLNNELAMALRDEKDAYFVDTNLCLARVGAERFYDRRYWHIGRAPYAQQALREIACEDFKFVRALTGRTKKCLVLDCDDVLWGGVVGENGLNGLQLGRNYPGSAYYEFQQELLNLYHRGVILALCSKNNEADVWEVFDRHPEMLLKREHIAAFEINWDDKVTNLKRLAERLNLLPESLVFADDSEFEIHLVKRFMPEIEVLHLPKEKSVEFRERLTRVAFFETLSVSSEDRHRGRMYQEEAGRKKLLSRHTDLDSYIKSLGLVAMITSADPLSIPRVAQLTQKTNQFNLTTCRYTETDIRHFATSPHYEVLTLSAKDRFGDSGLVGVLICEKQGEVGKIDTLLVSCRVLGRKLEHVFVDRCLSALAASGGIRDWEAEYIPTAKNVQAADFWSQFGFKTVEQSQSRVVYRMKEAERVAWTNGVIQVEGEIRGK